MSSLGDGSYIVAKTIDELRDTLAQASISHCQMADTLHFLRGQKVSPQQLHHVTHLSYSQIRHYCRLAKKLAPPVKKLLHLQKISLSLSKAIASLPIAIQEERARDAIMKGVSVHVFRDQEKNEPVVLDERTKAYFKQIEQVMSEQTGIALEITPDHNNKHAGIIKMRYTDLKDFDNICDRLAIDLEQ